MRAKTEGRASRPNLNDVAKTANVSASTVSLVLAGKAKERYISDEVILRVQDAAKSLDYSPNMLVRSMQRGQTHILCFFNGFRYDQAAQDLYTIGLFTAAAKAAGAMGNNLLLYCDFKQSAQQTYHTLNGGHADGVLFFAPQEYDPLLPYLRTSRLPTVLLNSEDAEGALSGVKDDFTSGMRQIADRLVALGHRKIVVLRREEMLHVDANRRVALLIEYLSAEGIAVPDSSVVGVNHTHEAVRSKVSALMASPDPPTAVFCWNDFLGYVVLDVCESLGISVPEQLSIVGYDGIRWPARTSHLLASVRVDLHLLAEEATSVLQGLITRRMTGPIRRIVPVEFDEGTTLAPPKH